MTFQALLKPQLPEVEDTSHGVIPEVEDTLHGVIRLVLELVLFEEKLASLPHSLCL